MWLREPTDKHRALTSCKHVQFFDQVYLGYGVLALSIYARHQGWALLMPRNRLLAQIDDELSHASECLRFWRDQLLLLDSTDYQVVARRLVLHREAEIKRLLEAQESLQGLGSVRHRA